MARPKTVPDEMVLSAAARVIGRRGPADFTLREVAASVGLSASTIVQRFGTKRALLVALARQGSEDVDVWFAEARERNPRPLDALVAALAEGADGLTRHGSPAHHLAFLQLDLADPDLRRYTRAFFAGVRANVEALLEEAIEAGALEEVDTAHLARTIEALYHGTLIVWTLEPSDTPGAVLRRSLGLVLGPRT